MKSYKIEKMNLENSYSIKYEMIAGGEVMGHVTDQLQISHGCISQFNYLEPSDVAPTK